MQFDVAALPAEDLEPLAKALSLAPPEKRGEVYMRIQNAGREFLAKATAGKPPSAATETDPIKRAVFGALTKQFPAPAPQLDPLKREALGSLEKAVMAGIRGAARGVGDAMGVTGRAGGMRVMRGAYRSSMDGAKDRSEFAANISRRWKSAMQNPSRLKPYLGAASEKRYGRTGVPSTQAGSFKYKDNMKGERLLARRKADLQRQHFNSGRRVLAFGLTGGLAAGAADYAMERRQNRPRKQKDQ
jgi:hypothetical protein